MAAKRAKNKSGKLRGDELRIFQVKSELGILNEAASEEIVNKLCLHISHMEEYVNTAVPEGATVLDKEEMEDLQGRLSMDSSNSSIPPRANGYRSPKNDSKDQPNDAACDDENTDGDDEGSLYTKNRSLRGSSGLHPGKQPGAEGHGLKRPEHAVVQETVFHAPSKCVNCPHFDACRKGAKEIETRHVYDSVTTITDTPHVTLSCQCPLTSSEEQGIFPEQIKSSQQYGNNIMSLAIVLNVLGMVSVDRIHEILSAYFSLPISTGTIQGWIEKADRKVKPILALIIEAILQSVRIHCDETGVHIKGKLKWIHTACNELFTYLSIQDGRGYDSICAVGILTKYKGIVIHDCLAGYWKFKDVIHGLCCAHLQRELKWVIQFKEKNRVWAQALFDLLGEMNKAVDEAKKLGKRRLDPDRIRAFSDRFDGLIEEAMEKNPSPPDTSGKRGRKKKGKVLSLVLRLKEHKDEVFLFATNFDATFSNNLAEASFRLVSQKRSVAGSFRSDAGAEAFVDLFSYLSTCRKHEIDCYTAISELLEGNAEELIFGKKAA